MSLAWHKWYAADWILCEARFELSLAERGMFRDLLDLHYMEGSIPKNPRVLIGFLSVSKDEFETLWPNVSKHFHEDPANPERLLNKRAAEELDNQAKRQKTQAVNGSRGGRPKANKNPSLSSGLANRKPIEEKRIEERREEQQQQAAADAPARDPAAAAEAEVLEAVQRFFPTARPGEKWARELEAVQTAELPAVAERIRRRPAKAAQTPVILVREAVAEVLAERAARRLEIAHRQQQPAKSPLEIIAEVREQARAGAAWAREILRGYADHEDPEVRAAARAALEGAA